MSDELLILLAGMVLGALLFGGSLNFVPGTIIYRHNELVAECEKELPRNQTCTISAVPYREESE